MTQAAEELHLTQSACSMSLSSFESQLDGPLFDRHDKKLILNERGKILFTKSVNIITQVNELQDLMLGKQKHVLSGTLVIGESTTIGNYVLPSLIGKFIKKHPELKLTLRISDTDHVIDELLKFNIDIGMIEGICRSEDIEIIPWKQDELIVIATHHHPLAKLKKITLNDLKSADWILREPDQQLEINLKKL